MQAPVLAWIRTALATMLLVFGVMGVAMQPRASPPMARAASAPLPVVAAENFYGDLLAQIGGDRVHVTSILSNPNADPHEYESSVRDARAVAQARLVVLNGLGYDRWMQKLLAASPRRERQVVNVGAGLLHLREGDNPHVWYKPQTFPLLARVIAADLGKADPAGKGYYAARLARFTRSLHPLQTEFAALRRRYAGTYVLATERVFGYAADAIGLHIPNPAFQQAIEDGNDPSPRAVAQFEGDLTHRRARLLLYNTQAVTSIIAHMRDLARKNHIPVVGVTETEPPGQDYQQWQLSQLYAIDHALSTSTGR
jgi:zinc/manganese transport system substrate-binding protein